MKDIEIAQQNEMEDIVLIADKINIDHDYLAKYGSYKAKVDLSIMNEIKDQSDGKLILVSAINPTSAGEGKSTTTIGLVDALNSLKHQTIGCLREPSMGPVFGLKGGATGGGYAQVVPMDDINLHFTGDIHAVSMANNLISACIDNHIYHGNELDFDLNNIVFKRAIDVNDRALRDITVAQGAKSNGTPRKDGFYISVASEIMAILCLVNNLMDFKKQVAQIVVGYNTKQKPIRVSDLKIAGALTLIMKDAIKPNLVQTLEKNPVFIHGGPFANIAHGCSSNIATKLALKLSDYVVTEAGFGADLGSEKFVDIAARIGQYKPNVVVLVASIRALKMHGNQDANELTKENIKALEKGLGNLSQHLETVQNYNLPCVVAINRFASDTQKELDYLLDWAEENKVAIALSDVYQLGSIGGQDLAHKVIEVSEKPTKLKYIYDTKDSFEDKLTKIITKCYGGKSFVLSEKAQSKLALLKANHYDKLPLCVAKTPHSLSDNAKLLGRPRDFDLHISDLNVSAGAGFIVVYAGDVLVMPGLPKEPAADKMDITADGRIVGLF